MKEREPKSDLWSRIEKRKDFESQLNDLIKTLPTKDPTINLWKQIEAQLDEEKQIFPIWRYVSVAVSIVLILAFGAIFFDQLSSKKAPQEMVTENSTPKAFQSDLSDKEEKLIHSEPTEELVSTEKEDLLLSEEIQKESTRAFIKPVKVPNKPLTFIEQKMKLVSDTTIALSLPSEKPKSLHKVTISWGLNEKTKLKTKLGSTFSDPAFNQQFGRTNENSIIIKLKKE
ncbi:hypothetical protein JYB64_19175 [Algoriphagus aestuarii]|nr:hypothetical protein [Algoriphagus aestuarii]